MPRKRWNAIEVFTQGAYGRTWPKCKSEAKGTDCRAEPRIMRQPQQEWGLPANLKPQPCRKGNR